ncbi:MAG: amylo-alpha-1,6-glucosidase [Kiritimatiellia bacterium]
MTQKPPTGSYLLRWKGDVLDVVLTLDRPRGGRAALRTNLGAASVRRREIIAQTETGETPLARAWRDVPMREVEPGVFVCSVPLDEVGVFSGKCCFFAADAHAPEWPAGQNFHVKVMPASTRTANAIYTVFPRQFGGAKRINPEREPGVKAAQDFLDAKGYAVIPPSGTLRDVKRALGHIMDEMKFRIVQLLPIFPTPTVFARMGRYGCPFAATDFLSVDPALAEFDDHATPLDQFRELADAVHAKGGLLFVDLPANHTGWAATLQTHHPHWYRRAADGRFVSPGAWGVTWADLVELDYANPGLRAYMADVFLFWCRQGVDGFRCDAGYMIPADTWTYIVARVREEYPDTVFMLEGLGGRIEVTDRLLSEAGLDWAYSEIFQTYDRGAFEWYLPGAIARAEKYGALVHFAETHDNDRLARGGKVYAKLRVQLAALLSHEGAWGIANGVEWYATEKIDVHGASSLNWEARDNLVSLIGRLNAILAEHPAFGPQGAERVVTRGEGNTLAVCRAGARPVLVLANLDCDRPAVIQWDAGAFDAVRVRDLITGRQMDVNPRTGTGLAPGEVLCLEPRDLPAPAAPAQPPPPPPAGPRVVWTWPEDARRAVCVPAGCALRVKAPHAFRVEVLDGARTVAVARSEGTAADLVLPPYRGDGCRAERRSIRLSVYAPAGVVRTDAALLMTPPGAQARVKLVYSGADIRRDPTLETILSDGQGSMSRVKLAWGEIRSQYDALFAVNLDPDVPSDRQVLWANCRCWLQHEGYSREINRDCVESFRADPAGRTATWTFKVPCGMGQAVRFVFTLALARSGTRAARLAVTRLPGDGVDAPVRIVFRPNLECRSFHATTKAFQGPESVWEDRIRAAADFQVEGGTFHPEGEWTYCVDHPEEAERGQDPSGDLFSPGWVSCDFGPGASAALVCRARARQDGDSAFPEPPARAPAVASVPETLRRSLELFIVKRDDVKTVIAGYPWFLDWGRDTFIFLHGAIAAGFEREALDIVVAFARFEERGTLPNIIYGNTAGNRDTTDAPLWFLVAVRDLVGRLGTDILQTDCRGRTLAQVMESIVANYVRGTPNGIRVDAASGLVWSPSHFTWMDTNYPACTPRVGYPVEIQALWIAALRFLGGAKWTALADRAEASLRALFVRTDGVPGLYDCLDAAHGEPAAQARPDAGIRPNQLFVLSLDALGDAADVAPGIVDACERLLVPGGIRSLADGDARYRGRYTGDEDTSRKPAYHNGTVWAWPFPMFAEALVKAGRASPETALSLLASAVENLNAGCVCQISENADGDAPHGQKGCRAQAWSASELLRVWLALEGRTR